MAVICPTVLAAEPHGYREQIARVAPLSPRLQIDLADGDFAAATITPAQAWLPEGVSADIHLMFTRPLEYIETLVSLSPSLVIIHAESKGDLPGMIRHLQSLGIKAGVALLQRTPVQSVDALIKLADHILIFAGTLGSFGGEADLGQLSKVDEIRVIRPEIEIGWDGGANESNIVVLADGGIDVINVGSAIQRAENPIEAYRHLVSLIS